MKKGAAVAKAGVKKEGKPKEGRAKRAAPRNSVLRQISIRDVERGALLLFLLVLVYFPALSGGPLWDDDAHITRPNLQSLSGLAHIWFKIGATQQYYPLLHTAFWVEHGLWGGSMLGYHLLNVLLHACAAFLLVAVLRKLAIPGAWLAAFLFALHPVQVETAAWISEQKNTLSTVFYLASALVYLRFDQTRARRGYWISLALFGAALASKTVAATLPAALLVILWWRNGRLEWKRDVVPLLPWLAVGAVAGLVTAGIEHSVIGAGGKDYALTLGQKCLLAGRVICFYTGKLLWPVDLTFIYPHWTIDSRVTWQYVFPAAVLAAAVGLALLARKYRGPMAGFLFFVGTLFPVLGFLKVYPFRFSYVADHFQYVACLGILVPVAAGLSLVSAELSGVRRKLVTWIGPAAVLVVSILSWNQSGLYSDAETLYRATVARNPESWMAHSNLGSVLMQKGRPSEAMVELESALRIDPDLAEAHNNVGLLLSDIPGQQVKAEKEFREALRLRPNYAEAHNDLGSLLADDPKRVPEAMAEYQAALRIDPNYAEAHNNIGSALSGLGRPQEAMQEFEEALRLNPDLAEAHANLGVALMKMPGRMPEAVSHFQAALRIRPGIQKVRDILAQIRQQSPASFAPGPPR